MKVRLQRSSRKTKSRKGAKDVSFDLGAWARKAAVFVAGLVVALVLLELALRAGGALFMERQDRRNQAVLDGEPRVVLCLGESTTAFGGDDAYPSQLQEILRERTGEAFSVVNVGVPGGDSSVLMSQLPHHLDHYRPEVVVAMMGANDTPGGAIPLVDVTGAGDARPAHTLKVVEFALQVRHSLQQSKDQAGRDQDGGASYGELLGRGVALAGEYRHLEAEDVLAEATALDPTRFDAWIELGRVYEVTSRPEEAQDLFARGVELCKNHGTMPCDRPLVEFARCLERQELYPRSEEQFRLALRENEHSAMAWFGLGRILRKQERFDAAALAFGRVIELDPHNPEAHVSLGLCLESLVDVEGAEEHLRAGWDLRPGDRRAFIRLADFYERQERHEALSRLGAEALDAAPDDDIVGWLASYYQRLGDAARAEEYLSRADEIRASGTSDMTRGNYLNMERILRARGIQFVAVQYPVRSAEPLHDLFAGNDTVVVVDNSGVFRAALQERRFDDLFWDRCYGDFGHCTREGNHILAGNVANAIITRLLDTAEAPATAPSPLVPIPGGTFPMGALDEDPDARDCERPRHEVTVSPFQLDRTEVTVAAYAEAVAAGVVSEPGCTPHDEWGEELCNYRHGDRGDHPVNGVSWTEADAYCRWRGARLPTEAELEFALRAGHPDGLYPWGDSPLPPRRTGNYAGDSAPGTRAEGPVLTGYDDGYALTAPVASFPPDTLGVYDLSGNVWEWCSDWFGPDYYATSPAVDPAGPAHGERRILRGGNFYCIREELRTSERHHKRPEDEAVYTGFRCAADAPG